MADNSAQGGPREELLDLMFTKVDEDKYPSPTMLDIIEKLMGPDDVDRYAELLMSKVRDENYPSMSMVRRIMALA